MAKADIIAAIQAYVDSLDPENLDLRRALGNPANGPILLRGETADTGIAYAEPGFLDALLEGIVAGAASQNILVFGGKGTIGNKWIVPGFGDPMSSQLQLPLPAAKTLVYASARLLTGPTIGNESRFKFYKNGNSTGEQITITGGQTTGTWSGSISFSINNRISIYHQAAGEASFGANGLVSLLFQ